MHYDLVIKYLELKKSLEKLYYSAHWTSDRLDNKQEAELWENVKETAGLKDKAPIKLSNSDKND